MAQNMKIPRVAYRRQVYYGANGEVFISASGEMGLGYSRIYAPSTKTIRAMLLRLRREQGWSRATLASVLATSKHTVRSWESGARNPCGSAKKLIWIVYTIFSRPAELLKDLNNLVTWGHGRDEVLVLDDDEGEEPTKG